METAISQLSTMQNLVSNKQLSEDTEVVVLISNIERLKSKIEEENKKINLCIHILEKEHPNYCDYLEVLKVDVSLIRDKLNLSFSEKEKIDEKLDVSLTEDLKILYRKISIKCHPDKTDNNEFHELFKNAKKAYSKLDYIKLKEIYEKVYGVELNTEVEQENKIENLKKQLRKVETDYLELTKMNTYIMTSLYNSDKPLNKMKSKKLFLDLLFSKIFELETLKSNLTTHQ